jgi:hypothetical protein
LTPGLAIKCLGHIVGEADSCALHTLILSLHSTAKGPDDVYCVA